MHATPNPLCVHALILVPPPPLPLWLPRAEMKATQQEMADARLDLAYRDHCAHLLIPLNTCRRKEFFMPFKCQHERHEYEKCQYYE